MYTVIIADDEILICNAIQSVIHSALPELEVAQVFHDGTEVYDYLGTNQADILLLDIEMPGKSGLDIAQLIDEHNHKSYVIIITAYHDFEYAKKAIDYRVDAFITKPFSSQQLIAAMRKAVSFMEQKSASETNNRQTYRSLLQTLCTCKTDALHCDNISLCANTTPIKELLCTEITVKDEGLFSLSSEAEESMIQALSKCCETDNTRQSTFFLGNSKDSVTFLIFSKQEPDCSFLEDAVKIISSYSGMLPQYTQNTYPSLFAYRSHLSSVREMDTFFGILASEGANNAKKQLINYIHSLPADQLENFARYLNDNYPMNFADSGSGFNANIIIQNLDALIRHTLGTRSSNYIVDSALEYIQKNYGSPSLSLEIVADALSVSSVYLSRIFKKHTLQNFSEYVFEFRMEQAQRLLKSTAMPTVEISEAVGYSNPAYFRMSFKTRFGMTPRQFRQIQGRKDGDET